MFVVITALRYQRAQPAAESPLEGEREILCHRSYTMVVVHMKKLGTAVLFPLQHMEAVFLEVIPPDTPHLVCDDPETSSICYLMLQVNVEATGSVAQGAQGAVRVEHGGYQQGVPTFVFAQCIMTITEGTVENRYGGSTKSCQVLVKVYPPMSERWKYHSEQARPRLHHINEVCGSLVFVLSRGRARGVQ